MLIPVKCRRQKTLCSKKIKISKLLQIVSVFILICKYKDSCNFPKSKPILLITSFIAETLVFLNSVNHMNLNYSLWISIFFRTGSVMLVYSLYSTLSIIRIYATELLLLLNLFRNQELIGVEVNSYSGFLF